MERSYKLIIWGIALIFLHFRINGLDILPDFIGYICIMSGAMNLYRASDIPAFRRAGTIAKAGVILELILILRFVWLTSDMIVINYILVVLTQLVMIALIYHTYEGSIGLIHENDFQLAADMRSRQRLVVGMKIVTACVYTFGINIDDGATGIGILVLVLGLSAAVIWALNMNTMRKYCHHEY